MVPPSSLRVPRARRYSCCGSVGFGFGYVTLTLSGIASQRFLLPSPVLVSVRPLPYFYRRFGLFRFRSPLLSESRLISLPPPTEMFQFSGFPPLTYGFSQQYMIVNHVGFPIRISPDLGLFAAPRGFSQLTTSFFGSWCQGIPLALFHA